MQLGGGRGKDRVEGGVLLVKTSVFHLWVCVVEGSPGNNKAAP